MPKCSNCGAELGVGNRFCTSCGTAASGNVELPKEGSQEKLGQPVLISDNNDNSIQNTMGTQIRTKVRNYKEPFNFYFTEKGVAVFFSEYELAPYVSGIPEFLITKGVSIK